jgi:hypothetical protein
MVECARDFMLLVDFITLLLGLAIIGVSIYVLVAYASFGALVTMNTVYISLAVGVLLTFVACFGCVASRKGHKTLLCIYLCFITIALAGQIAATVLIANYAGQISLQSTIVTGSITSETDRLLNNAILSTYTSCCTGCPQPEGCNNAQPYFNKTQLECASNGVLICQMVPICTPNNVNDDGCYLNPGSLYPPVSIDQGLCDLFKTFTNSQGVPLVGSAPSGACGGGSPTQYTTDFVVYFNSIFYYFIIGFGVLCGLQGLNLLAAIFLLCCVKDNRAKG